MDMLARMAAGLCVGRVLMLLCFSLSVVSASEGDEVQLLLKLKSVLETPSTAGVFSSWRAGDDKCGFTGIVCNSDGFVTEIDLSRKGLAGTLPFDSICSLGSLQKIDLGDNLLHGNVAADLRNCTSLKYLDLGFNSFSGKVPDLSTLSGLDFLNLNNSGFSGVFPWKSLENMTDLGFLSLGDNPFDVTSPFPMEVIKLEKLNWLYLTNCSIRGQIPEGIGNLTLLENLELSDNELSGEIPRSIARLGQLWQLELYNNSLTGKLPLWFGNLTRLMNFDASHNRLGGDLSEIRFLTSLASLQLFENQLTGEIPEELGELKNLTELSLYSNRLTGSLPPKLGSLADFNYIDVSDNSFTGSIPPDMCKNGEMTDLLMLDNRLTGTIPATYASCSSLTRLRLSNNSLSGAVPAGIWGLPNLTIIDLAANRLEGSIASDIRMGKSLAQLLLSDNRFSGELPEAMSEASSLVSIQLSLNGFVGKIPSTIGNLTKLNTLDLNGNLFSSSIPESIGSCVALADVNLSNNSLTGEIPDSIGNLPTLNSLNLSNNELSGVIPSSLALLKLSLLDLSNNRLTGPIPDSLSIEAYHDSFDGNPGLCSQRLKQFQPCISSSQATTHLGVILSCFFAGIFLLLIVFAITMYLKFRKKSNSLKSVNSLWRPDSWNMKPYRVLSFTQREIIDHVRTENLIGRGGSGNVYKVVLGNGKELAVKHIWASSSGSLRSHRSSLAILSKKSTGTPEYDAEVAALSSIRHVNVVKLYCSITSEDSHLLVYEYLPNGSVWDRLHESQKMEMGWDVRYEIALGAARGLEYLHHGCARPIIHRDVKSSNILLDEEWKPRIADFGLAKIVQPGPGGNWTHAIAGTLGYIAPEYAYTMKINEKSDVYSFGVVLMELVTGRRPIESEFGENEDIVRWVRGNTSSEKPLLDLVDANIPDTLKEDAVEVLRIAILCTANLPTVRPSMRMVVQMLEEAEPISLKNVLVDKVGENSQQTDLRQHFIW
ncbi:receptor-like protein kinase 7 isoform X2 [Rhodamnia argentea]|uniref:Receptor-like protein kinase 7 isoform X2 n=1 Tax=Rhodamnia argentea TaxID=178133 RepID=A0A8B8PVN7_9MYRT|nr:receptor-like protein kinase 7 isoform X2 [Rhodamnia argentea]